MHRRLIILALFALYASPAVADLSPLQIEPVSVTVTGDVQASGTATATFDQPFSHPGGCSGQIDGAVSIQATELLFDIHVLITQSGGGCGASLSGELVLDFDVPDVGDGMTPVFLEGVIRGTNRYADQGIGMGPKNVPHRKAEKRGVVSPIDVHQQIAPRPHDV